MALTYTCPTCGKIYPASISGGRVTYMVGNKVIELKSESDDCQDCLEKIKAAEEETRAKIRQETTPKEQDTIPF